MIHVWTAPRITSTNGGAMRWRSECFCGEVAHGVEPAGVIAEMQKHESAMAAEVVRED